MQIAVPAERGARERRVALTPRAVATLTDHDIDVVVERGAGTAAGFPDPAYAGAGAVLVDPGDERLATSEVVTVVGPPPAEHVAELASGTLVVGFLDPFGSSEPLATMRVRGVAGLAFEAVPRTTLAQNVDALSSQATAAGYAAVMLAATRLPKFLPMLTTAAGTVAPARVLVIGAGVAGLQAIATARRLGARVSAYDVRPEAQEQIESLGARAIDAPLAGSTDPDGYAAAADEALHRAQVQALARHVGDADAVITTAAVPGGTAPVLIEATAVSAMAAGSVIVDLAAASGGNCRLTRADEEVLHDGVVVLGPTDLPSRVARDASEMYARNVLNLLDRLIDGDRVALDLDDDILGSCCVVYDGVVRHPRALVADPVPIAGSTQQADP